MITIWKQVQNDLHRMYSYDLTRFAAIDTLAEFNLSTFLMRYRYFTQVEDYIVHKYDLQDECHKTGDFMSKTFDEC